MRRFFLLLLLSGCSSAPSSLGLRANTLNVADAAMTAGNPNLALRVSINALRAHPNDLNAKLHEAQALDALGRTSQSCMIYEQTYAAQPSAMILRGLSKCMVRESPQRALKLLNGAISENPEDANLLTNRGVAEDFLGNHHAAQIDYQKALHINPLNVATNVDYSLSLAFSGQVDNAASLLQPLAEASDSDRKIREDYGAVLALGGHVKEASNILAFDLPSGQAHTAALAYRALGPVRP